MILSTVMLVTSLDLINHRNKGRLMILLSLALLLVGGGFVPVFIGVLTGSAACLEKQEKYEEKKFWRFIATIWPWPVLLMVLWMPGSWLLGHFYSQFMLELSSLSFVLFDLGMPVLTLLSAYGYRSKTRGSV